MTFVELVDIVLNEAGGVDPMKFAYKGAPQGFRKDTGISNPETFVPDSPSRKMYDPASAREGTKAKSGQYIVADVHKLIKTALMVTAADPDAGTELKRVLENFAQPYHEYRAADAHAKRLYDAYDKLRNKDTPHARKLKEESEEYMRIAGEWKTKANEITPETLDAIQDLVKEGGQKFVEKLSDEAKKSLEDADVMEIPDENEKRATEFLKDIWGGKSDFEPLLRFVENEKQEGKNPLPRILTIYKSVIVAMVENNLVNSPERLFSYITGLTGKVRGFVDPNKGRSEMKRKDPSLATVIAFIKKQRYNDAKEAVNTTKLTDGEKADLMINIEKLSKGEMTEADVIRPLYAK